MLPSRKQAALVLRRALATRSATYLPQRPTPTHVASLLHDSLGLKLPPSIKPVILPGDVGLIYNDLLVRLRTALDSGNPSMVWRNFTRLREAGHADHLGEEDLRAIDTALASTVFRLVSRPPVSHPTDKVSPLPASPQPAAPIDLLHDLALWLSLRGQICLLRACMLRALKFSNPKIVLDLWHAYVKRSLAGEGAHFITDDPPPNSQPPVKLGSKLNSEIEEVDAPQNDLLRYAPGRPELLALAICAYAMAKDFRGAFRTVHATLVPVNTFVARRVFEPLIAFQEGVVADALQYVGDLSILRLLARPASFRNHVNNLAENRGGDKLGELHRDIIKLLSAKEPWVGPLDKSSGPPTISSDPDARPLFSVSRQTWSDLIEISMSLKFTELTNTIIRDLASLKVRPTTGMWNALMSGYAQYGDFGQAWKVWDGMGEKGRDVYTYTAMMQALFKFRKPDEAVRILEEMKAKFPNDATIRPYNILLHGLFINGRTQAALELYSQLEATVAPSSSTPTSKLPTPDITTFNTALQYYARKRDMNGLSGVLRSIAAAHINPDIYTFATVLDALIAVGAQDAPSRVLGIMKALNVEPNAAIVSALIEELLKDLTGRDTKHRSKSPRIDSRALERQEDIKSLQPERLQAAVKLLIAFEDAGVETNEINYTALMAGFHRAAGAGAISHPDAQAATKALRERMRKRKLFPNRATYNILISACLERPPTAPPFNPNQVQHTLPPYDPHTRMPIDLDGVPGGVRQAVAYFHEMRGADVLPNHATWYTLLSGVMGCGQVRLARSLSEVMLESGFVPQTGLLKLVMRIRGGGR
ncbi:hypothetical protein BDV93DRAFT_522068 [Ceratobasidium sp. AG-I]|nr:hypothetical protein BDV93DRAFT_522068 [Ceratobasidium sp. AG-I]